MQVALVQVCVDERLNHELIRIQVKHKLAALYLSAQRIFILNEVGGNLGENFRNTADAILKLRDEVVLAGVLHHDDCRAARVGLRRPLEETIAQMADFLAERGIACPIASGNIYTANNHVIWLQDVQMKAEAKTSPTRR
jgi:hypothetical protein